MYDGKQVLRYANKYKSKDLYNIGVEMEERKGTGFYDEKRTKFNVDYVPLTENNLYQQVKTNLEKRNIKYLKKDSTTMLNGAIFTSGPEFFEALGMKFEATDKKYQTGDKKGQIIKKPVIDSVADIPYQVTYFFDCCMEYLKNEVGEENIIMAQVHYDENTPHLQTYFVPVVNAVNRKCYAKDKNGNVIKEETTDKKTGKKNIVPKLLRDDKGKIVYETVNGIALNNDQFWRDRGAQFSFKKSQDIFNDFITSKGFKLDRGNVGADKAHEEKLSWQVKELNAEIEVLRQEKEFTSKEIEHNKNSLLKANKNVDKEILNPKQNKVLGFNFKDVTKLIDYSKNLEQINIIQADEIVSKDKLIEKLETENISFRDNKEIKKRNEKIIEQQEIIKDYKSEISRLNLLVNSLENTISKLTKTLEKWKNKFFDVIDKIFGKEVSTYEDDYLDYADDFIKDHKHKEKDKDYEIGM